MRTSVILRCGIHFPRGGCHFLGMNASGCWLGGCLVRMLPFPPSPSPCVLEFLSDGRLADSPSDLTRHTLTVTRLLHGIRLEGPVQGELTCGLLQNVQVAMQLGIAYILSISPLPVTNGALQHVPPPSQCWDSCAIYIAHFYVLLYINHSGNVY